MKLYLTNYLWYIITNLTQQQQEKDIYVFFSLLFYLFETCESND